MITRENNELTFTCDACEAVSEAYDPNDFAEAWTELKDEGWRAFKDENGEWQHRCPECRGKDKS